MTPIPPASIWSFVQAGYPVDLLLRLCVRAINGIYNHSAAHALRRAASPAFDSLLETLRRLQNEDAFGFRLEQRGEDLTAVVFLRRGGGEALDADLKLLTQTLGLKPDAKEYLLSFGALPRNDEEIAVLSRSMLEIIVELAAYVEVPKSDVDERRTTPTADAGSRTGEAAPLVRVRNSDAPPFDAFAATRYRGRWFWIDDRDLVSKRIFAFVMLLISLSETGGLPNAPVLTIQTGP
jgi:hypothetical protein